MAETYESDIERLRRYISGCKTCSAEGVEEHILKLKNLIDKYPSETIEKFTHIFKALGNPIRVKILILLFEKVKVNEDLCYCEINVIFGVSQSTISHHLNVLEQAGLISNYTQGKWKYYQLSELGTQLVKFLE